MKILRFLWGMSPGNLFTVGFQHLTLPKPLEFASNLEVYKLLENTK